MNFMTIFTQFPDQEACIEHMENVRWGDDPSCPHCGSVRVARKQEKGRIGRWNCHDCKSSFNVLNGTVMEKTRLPLQKWFLAISLMLNAKKGLSSCQLARDLDMRQKSAWYMQQRIRAAMLTKQKMLLHGVIEADETYVGGKPRKKNRREDDKPNPRGRGTRKAAVIGAVERGGRVVAKIADDLSGKGVLKFLKETVDPKGTLLITDEFTAYNTANPLFRRSIINHVVQYVDGDTHTNTIEGFWSLLKRAWYGSHHHYSRNWMPLYVAEACWKYNQRRKGDAFGKFMRGCFV